MRRLLRIRILIVIVALAMVPAATLPFAERLRTEWARYWEPKPDVEEPVGASMIVSGIVTNAPVNLSRTYRQAGSSSVYVDRSVPSPGSSLRFSEAQELGEMAGAIDRDSPAIER